MKKQDLTSSIEALKQDIAKCELCKAHFTHEPNPVVKFSPSSKIVIIGQAPGTVVHRTGIPWDDKSGENLRNWMDMDTTVFYDEKKIAIVPMGFCYPGKGKSGDLPPRKECAPQWHDQIWNHLAEVELILLIGKYAQDYYLKKKAKRNLTETVKHFADYLPKYFVLPHPSPRNNIWKKKNPWFEQEVLPILKLKIAEILTKTDQ